MGRSKLLSFSSDSGLESLGDVDLVGVILGNDAIVQQVQELIQAKLAVGDPGLQSKSLGPLGHDMLKGLLERLHIRDKEYNDQLLSSRIMNLPVAIFNISK